MTGTWSDSQLSHATIRTAFCSDSRGELETKSNCMEPFGESDRGSSTNKDKPKVNAAVNKSNNTSPMPSCTATPKALPFSVNRLTFKLSAVVLPLDSFKASGIKTRLPLVAVEQS